MSSKVQAGSCLRRSGIFRVFTAAFALLLALQMSGVPHLVATMISGEVADCTSPSSTNPQDGRCLPFCPTCACVHLGRSATVSSPEPLPTPVEFVAWLAPLDDSFPANPHPDGVFHPPRSLIFAVLCRSA